MRLVILLVALALPALAQNECPSGTLPFQTMRDTSDVLHQTACYTPATGRVTFPFATISNAVLTIGSNHVGLAAANNDTAGKVGLIGGSAPIFFSTVYSSAPTCVCSNTTNANAAPKCVTSTTGIQITGNGSDVISYICFGNPN